MTIATYVINLDGSDERLDQIRNRLDSLSISFERVPAFDGRKLDLANVADYDPVRALQYMGRRLVGGEIGCFRSHLASAARFLKSGASYGLVLEDDALPVINPISLLMQALPELDNIDPDWLLVNIGNNKLKIASSVSHYQVEDRMFSLMAAHYFPMTTNAIVWSRKGAQCFIDEHDVIFAPVDNYFRYWLTREGHGYSFWPSPVSTALVDSLIDISGKGQINSKDRARNKDREWYYGLIKKRRLLNEKLIAMRKKWQFRIRPAVAATLDAPPGRYL